MTEFYIESNKKTLDKIKRARKMSSFCKGVRKIILNISRDQENNEYAMAHDLEDAFVVFLDTLRKNNAFKRSMKQYEHPMS